MKTCSLAVEPAEDEDIAIPLARFITYRVRLGSEDSQIE